MNRKDIWVMDTFNKMSARIEVLEEMISDLQDRVKENEPKEGLLGISDPADIEAALTLIITATAMLPPEEAERIFAKFGLGKVE